MKKIQKSILMLAALLMAGAAFTSCTNESDPTADAPKPAEGKYFMTVYATWSNDATRAVAFDETNNILKCTWTQGDKVLVLDADYDSDAHKHKILGTLTAQNSGASTTLTGKVEAASNGNYMLVIPTDATANYPAEMYWTGQVGTLAGLSNYDFAWVQSVAATSYDAFTININDAVFTNPQAIVKFTLLDEETEEALPVTKLSISCIDANDNEVTLLDRDYSNRGTSVGSLEINLAQASNIVWTAIHLTTNNPVTVNLTATTANGTYIFSQPNANIVDGNFYNITVKMQEKKTRTNYLTQEAQTWQVND